MHACVRKAFSLLELLVSMAIIGLLTGLLLPAVQKVRKAAAKAQSSNNLHQIGLALHQHHDARGHFPPGYMVNTPSDLATLDGPPGWAWGVFLLPWLEQDNLHRQLRFDLPCWHATNAALVNTPVKVFINPAAPNRTDTVKIMTESGTPLAEFSRSHYVANAGQDEPWGYDPPLADWSSVATGPFFKNSRTRSANVTDGLSTTVFVGEHTSISDKTWVGVVPGAASCPLDPQRFPFTECDSAATLVLAHSGPAASEPGVVHPPGFPTCHVCQMFAPWAGGGLVLFGDGSVRFIQTTINLDAWAAMSSMNLGDSVNE